MEVNIEKENEIDENSQTFDDSEEDTDIEDDSQNKPPVRLFEVNNNVPETQMVLAEDTQQQSLIPEPPSSKIDFAREFGENDVDINNSQVIVQRFLKEKRHDKIATSKLQNTAKNLKITMKKTNNRKALFNTIAKKLVKDKVVSVASTRPSANDITINETVK